MDESDAQFREQVVAALPRLRRFSRALTRHRDDADDLVQVAVERALTRAEQWRPGWSVLNWMVGIVRNAWIDEVRSRRLRADVLQRDAGSVEAGTTDEAEIERWTLLRALDRLPDEQRLAVALVLVAGLSYKEAAAVMATPIGTLTSRLARGRLALEAILAGEDRPQQPEAQAHDAD